MSIDDTVPVPIVKRAEKNLQRAITPISELQRRIESIESILTDAIR